MTIHIYVVDIFEKQHRFPIVRHEFRGKTQEEALHYFESHMAADDFLYDCFEKGLYDKKVKCRTETRWRRERT